MGGAETNRAVEVNCLLDGGAVRRHESPHLALHARDARRAAHQHHLPRKGGARGANHLRVHAGMPLVMCNGEYDGSIREFEAWARRLYGYSDRTP